MPKKGASATEEEEKDKNVQVDIEGQKKTDVAELSRMLAAVLNYLSDDEVEEIDIESLLDNTEGLRDWWDSYREENRKKVEEEIMKSIENLSFDDLESIREKIKEFQSKE